MQWLKAVPLLTASLNKAANKYALIKQSCPSYKIL
jgi:hypothetical protein